MALTIRPDEEQTTPTRAFMQKVAMILNSLLITGQITQTGAGDWSITQSDETILAERVFRPKGEYGMYGG